MDTITADRTAAVSATLARVRKIVGEAGANRESLERVRAELITLAQQRGLLWVDHARIQPTEKGFDFLSDLQALFLPESTS